MNVWENYLSIGIYKGKKFSQRGAVMIVWLLDLQLPV